MGQRAFSLVELSIVLVILGLLTGGILAGQSLIRGAEMRKIITSQDKYKTAARSFQDKYFALPGDFSQGTRFWGAKQPTSCVNNAGAAVNATSGTCDGDGNGQINSQNSANVEQDRTWEQLSLSGLIEGKYGYNVGAGEAGAGISFPFIGMGQAAANMGYIGAGMSSTNFHNNSEFNAIFIGGPSSFSSGYGAGIAKPEEAWNIDTKLDDGQPGRGNVLVRYDGADPTATANRCVSAYSSQNATYNFQYSMATCNFVFRM